MLIDVGALLEVIRPHVIRYMAIEYRTALIKIIRPTGNRNPKYRASSRSQQLWKHENIALIFPKAFNMLTGGQTEGPFGHVLKKYMLNFGVNIPVFPNVEFLTIRWESLHVGSELSMWPVILIVSLVELYSNYTYNSFDIVKLLLVTATGMTIMKGTPARTNRLPNSETHFPFFLLKLVEWAMRVPYVAISQLYNILCNIWAVWRHAIYDPHYVKLYHFDIVVSNSNTTRNM